MGKQRGRKFQGNVDRMDVQAILEQYGSMEAFFAAFEQKANDAEFLEAVENNPLFKPAQTLLERQAIVDEQIELIREATEEREALKARLLEQLHKLDDNAEALEAALPSYEQQAAEISARLEEFRAAHSEGRSPNLPKRELAQGPGDVPVLKRHSATGMIYIA